MSKRSKIILRFVFVAVLVGIIVYTFRDQAGPVCRQLRQTSPVLILTISLSALLYNVIEGWVLTSMMRQEKEDFPYRAGFFCSCYSAFYRVATMGSGSGIASILYLNKKGIPYSMASGYYLIHYMLHKLGIVIFAAISFLLNYQLIKKTYWDYFGLLLSGSLLALLICGGFVVVCCWAPLHAIVIHIFSRLDKKGKFRKKIGACQDFFDTMETTGKDILKRRSLVLSILARNLLKLYSWYVIPFLILRNQYPGGLKTYTGLAAIGSVLASVIPAPAGIGSTELTFTMLFTPLTSKSVAVSTALLYRFASFVVPFLFGGFLALAVRFKGRRQTGRAKERIS